MSSAPGPHATGEGVAALADSGQRWPEPEPVEPRVGAVTRVGMIVLVQAAPSRYFDLGVNGQRIRCRYGPELDQAVIQGIGQIVEVAGQGTFDGNEEPSEIAVDNVDLVDFAPLVLAKVETEKGTFHFYEPLRFDISYGDGLLIAKNQDFRTLSYGRNRQELMEDIAADIAELWRAYVEESPDRLTEGALSFRRRLQRRIYRSVGCTWADPGCTPAGS